LRPQHPTERSFERQMASSFWAALVGLCARPQPSSPTRLEFAGRRTSTVASFAFLRADIRRLFRVSASHWGWQPRPSSQLPTRRPQSPSRLHLAISACFRRSISGWTDEHSDDNTQTRPLIDLSLTGPGRYLTVYDGDVSAGSSIAPRGAPKLLKRRPKYLFTSGRHSPGLRLKNSIGASSWSQAHYQTSSRRLKFRPGP